MVAEIHPKALVSHQPLSVALRKKDKQMKAPESVNVQAVLDAAPELFVDAAGEPRIGLPIPRGDPKNALTIWPLRDVRIRSEICKRR